MSVFSASIAGLLGRLADLRETLDLPEAADLLGAFAPAAGAGPPILGTQGGDLLVTPAGDNTNGFLILGLGGGDTLRGGPRSDTIDGGSGADGITGDRWQPGPGLWPSRGDNLIRGGSGNDSITASFGDDTVDGGSGDDVIRGYGGDGISPGQTVGFWAQDGSDVLDGGSGNDTITAYGGADLLRGGSGDDVLTGGIRVDTLVGGPGAGHLPVRLPSARPEPLQGRRRHGRGPA